MARELIIISTDRTIRREPAPKAPSLERMQAIVGGYIEVTSCIWEGAVCQMIVNEMGWIIGLPRNPVATTAFLANRKLSGQQDFIVGPALVLVGFRLK